MKPYYVELIGWFLLCVMLIVGVARALGKL